MPDLEWNQSTWAKSYDWSRGGAEWSGPWGTPKAQWFATLLPRIAAFLPAGSLLEIAPGFGRWTQFLLENAEEYCGVDLSEKCVLHCRERFSQAKRAQFFVNDGQSLAHVAARKFDLVFSFDSLVHADFDVMVKYIPRIVPLLRPGGVALIHHSNLGALSGVSHHKRSENTSAENVASAVTAAGGRLLIQEIVSWSDGILSDCFTLFSRSEDYRHVEAKALSDPMRIQSEARGAHQVFQHYLEISRDYLRPPESS